MSQFQTGEIALLAEYHDVAEFDCGEPERNRWLVERGLPSGRTDDARTYVATRGRTVDGFYALTVCSIIRGSLPGSLRRNAPDPVSGVLLAQLAVAVSRQKQGLGGDLMLHAMGQAHRVAEIAGCRLFTVHPARPDLVGYYRRFGFAEVAATPALMAMSMVRVRKILAAA